MLIMDELESLTDNELRIRLMQYGFANIPITITTRKTLIKKLRLYLQNAGSSLQKSSDLVTKYSSDEESLKTGAVKNRQKKSISNTNFPRPRVSSSSQATIKKTGNNSRNMYVSPVYISNDSDEEDRNLINFKRSPASDLNRQDYSLDDDLDSTSTYTKRLLQLRKDNINQVNQHQQLNRNRYTKARRNENGKAYDQKEITFGTDTRSPIYSLKKRDSNGSDIQRHSIVSMLLVGFPIIFFTLIIFAYLNMSSNIESTMHHETFFKICENETLGLPYEGDCIEETNIESSLRLLKFIATKLRDMSGDKDKLSTCKDMKVDEILTLCKNDLVELLNDKNSEYDITKDLYNVKYLIDRNPAWGLIHTGTSDHECFSLQLTAKSSVLCAIFLKIQKFFIITGMLSILGLLILALRKFYLFTLTVKEKRRTQIALIVDEVFSLLIEKSKLSEADTYLSVNEIRDKILTDKHLLSDALTQLEKNEKSLAFGFENINGEDVKVIRLIDNFDNSSNFQSKNTFPKATAVINNPRSDGNLKKWIGPAFDKCNKITPPTNCLKIRNMFDKYEINNDNLQVCIQDTILLKVREKGCKILDIQLDKKTCCVYVKCHTCDDAGIIHNEINGWWLDQRLVVVKFLKEEKYDQRFPNSNNRGILGLSTNVNISQSQAHCYYNNSTKERDSDSEF